MEPRPAWVRLLLANSPAAGAATDQPLLQAISTPSDSNAALAAGAAPLTVKVAPGSVWKVAVAVRSLFQSWAHAVLALTVRSPPLTTTALSQRAPSSPRVAVTVVAA